MMRSAFALFGPGRLGLRLALRLVALGWSCVAVRDRAGGRADSRRHLPSSTVTDDWHAPQTWKLPPVVFVTVPDDVIERVAEQIANAFDVHGTTILHTSGLHTSFALRSCRASGAMTASWHPLQSFPAGDDAGEVAFDGIPCAVEGDPAAEDIGFAIAAALGLRPWRIAPEHKALYHASASLAANLTHILVARAAQEMRRCGLPERGPQHPLQPLVETSLCSALRGPGLDGLTGPIARGDEATIAQHLEVLPADLEVVYRALVNCVTPLEQES